MKGLKGIFFLLLLVLTIIQVKSFEHQEESSEVFSRENNDDSIEFLSKLMRERRKPKSLTDREQCFKWGCSNWKLHFRKCQKHCMGHKRFTLGL